METNLSCLLGGFDRVCHVNVVHSVATNARFAVRLKPLMRFDNPLMQTALQSAARLALRHIQTECVAQFIRNACAPLASD
jgi:hypothetical protein